jgi:hypothetical protein
MSETGGTMTGAQVYQEQRKLSDLEMILSNAYNEANNAIRYSGAVGNPFDMVARERKAVAEQQAIVVAAQNSLGGPVYRIPAENVDHLRHEIENKVNKRADKLALPRVEIIELEQEIIESKKWSQETNEMVTARSIWQYVAIKGETPKVAGYEFVATLQHEEAGNIIRKIPSLRQEIREIEIPDLTSYRDVDPVCDHCGLRRQRKDTYLVFNSDTGDIQQVGSNCLGDFLGAADPQRYASYAEYLRDFLIGLEDDGEERYYGPRVEQAFEMREFLASTARMIRANGWNPASASEYPTSAQAWDNLENYGKHDRRSGLPLWIDITDQDYTLADETLEWVLTAEMDKDQDSFSDYEHNLWVAMKSAGVTYRTKGIVASAIRAYDRARENKLRREKQAAKNAVKGHVGQIGERSEHDVTLMKTVPIEDRYADRYAEDQTKPLYIFEDEAGNEIKWFSSRWLDGTFQNGGSYKINVKVKSHDDDSRFGKSTRVTHVKVVS